MTQYLAPILNDQQVDSNGSPLSGGLVYVYLAGSSTPAQTTSDKLGNAPNPWPIVLNTLGLNAQGQVWIPGGQSYKFVIKDSTGVVQRTIDNVSGVNDASASSDQWVLFQVTPTYVSGSTFTLPGDQTESFQFGQRVRTTNTSGQVYGTVVRSSYSTDTTTVVLSVDDGDSLDSGLTQVYLGSLTPANSSIPGTALLAPYRNRVINGSFAISQRNLTGSTTITAGAAIKYTLDRFYVQCTGADVTVAQTLSNSVYRLTLTGASSNTGTLIGTRIEAANSADWLNKQVYAQVTFRSTASVTVTWRAYTADAVDDFSSKTQIGTGTFTADGTRAYFDFPAGANAVNGVAIEFSTGAIAAGATLSLEQFQAESGQTTTFEFRPTTVELSLCQRYFEVGTGALYGYSLATVTNASQIPFKVAKRVTPSLTYGSTTTTNVTVYDATNPDTNSLLWRCTTTADGGFIWSGSWTASAEL